MHFKKHCVFLCTLLSLLLTQNCGKELPLQELALAKEQVVRAESLQASSYAPEEFQEAKKSLMAANEFAAEEKAGDAKKSADYAISKAYDALEKTLPKVATKARDEAVQSIDAADEAYAIEFAPDEFKKANQLREAGDAKMSSADRNLASYLREEKNEERKVALRKESLDDFEVAYNKFTEAKLAGSDARSVALIKSDLVRESAGDVEQILEKAAKYSGGISPGIIEERTKLQAAYDDIDAGKLKSANEKIKTSKKTSSAILASVVKDYAKERNAQATDVVEDANARFSELDAETLQKNSGTKDSFGSAQVNLGAANESLQASATLFEQEKYEDSIDQSEEAIRLSEISIDQVESLKRSALALKTEGTVSNRSMKAVTELKKPAMDYSSQIVSLGKGWKQYTVWKKNPPECLWRIAKNPGVYNDSKQWTKIYDANRDKIKNKDLIYIKQKLKIPPKGKKGERSTNPA